jgi:hypothetical protein
LFLSHLLTFSLAVFGQKVCSSTSYQSQLLLSLRAYFAI